MTRYEAKIRLGSKVKDMITDFEGITTAVSFHLYGCTQYFVQPMSKDGEQKEGDWIDEPQLEILEKSKIPKQPERNGGIRPQSK